MNRIITVAAAALLAAPAFAESHAGGDMGSDMQGDEQMSMLQQRLGEALSECDIDMDEDGMMSLTMAQVSGIVLTANSQGGSEECQRVEAIARGDM